MKEGFRRGGSRPDLLGNCRIPAKEIGTDSIGPHPEAKFIIHGIWETPLLFPHSSNLFNGRHAVRDGGGPLASFRPMAALIRTSGTRRGSLFRSPDAPPGTLTEIIARAFAAVRHQPPKCLLSYRS